MFNTLTPKDPQVKVSAELYAADTASSSVRLSADRCGERILDAVWQFFQDPEVQADFAAWQKARSA